MSRWRTRLFLDSLDERVVPDATPLTNPPPVISQAPFPTDTGAEPYGTGPTIPINFLMADPPAPTPGPFVPTPENPGPITPAIPAPLPGTSARGLTEAEQAETAALVKAIEAANTTIANLKTQRAGFVADQAKHTATVDELKEQLRLAKNRLDGSRSFRDNLLKRGYDVRSDAYVDAVEHVAEDRGGVAALELAIAIAQKPIDELQKSIDYCDKVVADIDKQVTAMKVRIADIAIAAAKGTRLALPRLSSRSSSIPPTQPGRLPLRRRHPRPPRSRSSAYHRAHFKRVDRKIITPQSEFGPCCLSLCGACRCLMAVLLPPGIRIGGPTKF